MANGRCRRNTMNDLVERLNLPDHITITNEELISFIRKMKNKEYWNILYERYVNGKSYGEIERQFDLVPCSCYDKSESAVKLLRNQILNHFKSNTEKSINLYLHSDILKTKGFGSKSVQDVIDFLLGMDYRPSLFYDLIINTLQENGFEIIYPKYLLKSPEYPYNLYSHFNIKSKFNP